MTVVKPLAATALSGTAAPATSANPSSPAAERADAFAILAALLAAPPSPALLEWLARLPAEGEEDNGPVGIAWQRLGAAARDAAPERLVDEYHDLFVGLTQGELVPYGSWYLTGSLMDRPLVRLRTALARLGFAREAGMSEPEDHAAILCEVMGDLIAAARGDKAAEDTAGIFYQTFLEPWLPGFFVDLQRAPSARFYAAVGRLGEQVLALESRLWSLPPDEDEKRPGDTARRPPTG